MPIVVVKNAIAAQGRIAVCKVSVFYGDDDMMVHTFAWYNPSQASGFLQGQVGKRVEFKH